MSDANDQRSTPSRFRQKRNAAASSQRKEIHEQPNNLLIASPLRGKEPGHAGNSGVCAMRLERSLCHLAIRTTADLSANGTAVDAARRCGG